MKEFDVFTSSQGNYHAFEADSVYSRQYENVNFIFADSNLSRDQRKPGKIDINEIRSQCKSNMTNVLLFHHGLTYEDGDDEHNLIENPNAIIGQLTGMPIQFFFHGHKHYASIYDNDFVDIGCGCFCEEVEWKAYVFNQFIVGYINSGTIVKVERWGYSGIVDNILCLKLYIHHQKILMIQKKSTRFFIANQINIFHVLYHCMRI